MSAATADDTRRAAYQAIAAAGLTPAGHLRAAMLTLLRWRLTVEGEAAAERVLRGVHTQDLVTYLRATMRLDTVEDLRAVARMSDSDIIDHCRDAPDLPVPRGRRLITDPVEGAGGYRGTGTDAGG
jgi:hypothetical protein